MKTFVMTVSRYFPKTHKRSGYPTYFVEKILSKRFESGLISFLKLKEFEPFSMFKFMTNEPKIHTIRQNYDLWEKRAREINEGKAILSIRYWSGKPYNSKQIEFCKLDKDSGVGIQELFFAQNKVMFPRIINRDRITAIIPNVLAQNDGLSLDDFKEWFKNYDPSKKMAVIHFTKFRY